MNEAKKFKTKIKKCVQNYRKLVKNGRRQAHNSLHIESMFLVLFYTVIAVVWQTTQTGYREQRKKNPKGTKFTYTYLHAYV